MASLCQPCGGHELTAGSLRATRRAKADVGVCRVRNEDTISMSTGVMFNPLSMEAFVVKYAVSTSQPISRLVKYAVHAPLHISRLVIVGHARPAPLVPVVLIPGFNSPTRPRAM